MISTILAVFTIIFAIMYGFSKSDNDKLIMKYFTILSAIITLYSMVSIGSVIGILLFLTISIFILDLILDMLLIAFPLIRKVIR